MNKRDNDLDAILEVLMFDVVPFFKEITKTAYGSGKFTRATIKDALIKLDLENWVFDKYLDKLEKDKYIEYDSLGFLSITNKGENFKINEGGFRGLSKDKSIKSERTRKKDYLLNFDYKWKKPLIIIGLVISVLGIIEIKSCTDSKTESSLQSNQKKDTLSTSKKNKVVKDKAKEYKEIKKESDTLKVKQNNKSKID